MVTSPRRTLLLWLVVAAWLAVAAGAGAQTAPGDPVRVLSGMVYSETADGRSLALDAFLPAQSALPAPAVVLVHGGAWRRGDRSFMTQEGRALARRGIAAFAIDYRRDEVHPFPGAVRDVAAAMRFVRSHSAVLNVDRQRVSVLGASAGGNLAALVGTDPAAMRLAGGAPHGVIALAGPMDLRLMARDAAALTECVPPRLRPPAPRPAPTGPRVRPQPRCTVTKSVLARLPVWLGCPLGPAVPWLSDLPRPAACPQMYAAGSPVLHASAGDAPMLLMHGARDRLVSAAHSRAMGLALARAGVPHQVTILASDQHGRALFPAAVERIAAFLRRP